MTVYVNADASYTLPGTLPDPSVAAKEFGQEKEVIVEREQGERHHLRRDFWERLLARATEKGFTLHAKISPSQANWIGTQKSGIEFNYAVWLEEKTAVEVYIDTKDIQRNKQIFDDLYAHIVDIEGRFGDSLEWQRRDEGQGSRIRFELYKGGLNNRENWPQIIDATIDAMRCLYEAVNPFLVYSQ